MKCMVCGKEIYTSPDSVRCFGCASGYKSLRPTSKPVVPSDCVPKSDLRKLVKEERTRLKKPSGLWRSEAVEPFLMKLDELIKRGE